MRGKGLKVCEHRLSDRITPAYAGKRSRCQRAARLGRDHPRLCGEKLFCCPVGLDWLGSPPPMRGKVYKNIVCDLYNRITPAYAGKSFRKTAVRHAIKDHPRLCGEKQIQIVLVHKRIGSPPPMRGKVGQKRKIKTLCRITPAYAGKSRDNRNKIDIQEDHPRLCGEKPAVMISVQSI